MQVQTESKRFKEIDLAPKSKEGEPNDLTKEIENKSSDHHYDETKFLYKDFY